MKQRRVCAASSLDAAEPLDDADGKQSALIASTAAALQPSELAFARWTVEEQKNATLRERLRRLLLAPTVPVEGGKPLAVGSAAIENVDDGATRDLAFDVLCRDASASLLRVALATKAEIRSSSLLSPVEYRAVIEALLTAAHPATLVALVRHLVARSISWRSPGNSGAAPAVVASRQKCAIAALPIACLTLAAEYVESPWRLAAVCRQWWRCVRDTPLRLSHHVEFALQRLDAFAHLTWSAQTSWSTQTSASRTVCSAVTVAERASAQDAETARIEREIFARTVPTYFRTRTTAVKFDADVAFRSLCAVTHFLTHLVALQRVEITLCIDDIRDNAGTAPLDTLDGLPHLDTLVIAFEHVLDGPADFDMHVPHLPSLTHLDCRTRALKARRGADSTDAPTLHIRCKSLRVLRLSGRGRGDRARAAVPRIAWEDAQALEELALDFGDAETDASREYELAVFAQCLDVDASIYDREGSDAFVGDSKLERFARSMQRLRRLEFAGHFALPSHLAVLETVRFREFVGHQERVWSTLTSLRAIRGRIDFMSDAVELARSVAPNVTHVDIDARTSRATAPELAAMREFAARLAATGGALTWNGSATFPPFRVTDEEQEVRECDERSEGEDERSEDEDERSEGEDALPRRRTGALGPRFA